jgi:hypothetical protein
MTDFSLLAPISSLLTVAKSAVAFSPTFHYNAFAQRSLNTLFDIPHRQQPRRAIYPPWRASPALPLRDGRSLDPDILAMRLTKAPHPKPTNDVPEAPEALGTECRLTPAFELQVAQRLAARA